MTRHRLTEQQKADLANIKRLIASVRGKSRTDSVKYFRIGEEITLAPPGRVLVHSRFYFPSLIGFRVWTDNPSDRYEVCACGWKPELGTHYRIAITCKEVSRTTVPERAQP
jgi:hypothetical protein